MKATTGPEREGRGKIGTPEAYCPGGGEAGGGRFTCTRYKLRVAANAHIKKETPALIERFYLRPVPLRCILVLYTPSSARCCCYLAARTLSNLTLNVSPLSSLTV